MFPLGTADDELWPIIQKKLDVLNKAGLSKDNFKDSESHTVSNATSNSNGDSKITDYFSNSFTEEDIAALDDEWNGMCVRPLKLLLKVRLCQNEFMKSSIFQIIN